MPDQESFNIALLYIPLSVIGLWRWSYWLIRRLGAASYRPDLPWRPTSAPRLSVSVVTPVYNEDPDLFDKAVRSWQRNGVDEIIAVIDKSNVQHIVRCQRDYVDDHTSKTRFRLVVTPKPGKRAALCDGIELATGELIALVDSDTVWADDVLRRTVPYFANGAIGGATVAQRISNPTTVGNVLFDILLWTRYREEVPFLLGVGRVFNTLSGRTAFYRREALLNPDHDNMHALRHEFFMGARAVSGDDKRLSHLIIRQGWETAYVLDTCVYTPGLGSLGAFLKQRLRWTRNSWRADLKAVAARLGVEASGARVLHDRPLPAALPHAGRTGRLHACAATRRMAARDRAGHLVAGKPGGAGVRILPDSILHVWCTCRPSPCTGM